MADMTSVVDDYIAAWNETDAGRRRELVARTFADDATYLDPLMDGAGTDGIDALIGGAQRQFPGARFELAGGPDAHHDVVRFVWHLHAAGGERIATGHDYATVAEDGRLRAVTGFLET
ncbi:MAG: nuclear transport factor 2 family protein [Solirubrobacterales bacterium]|nr:nuclear transport factor 2 family protein [Solirubrobacterales bacterium]